MKGGYQIIDLGGIKITTTSKTIARLYNKIKNANGKPIVLKNFTVGDTEIKNCNYFNYSQGYGESDTTYVIVFPDVSGLNYLILVTEEDGTSLVIPD